MGVSLFYRHGRGAIATGEGGKLLTSAEIVLSHIARIREDVVEERGVARGKVTLAMPPFLAAVLGQPLVRHMAKAHPEIQLHLLDGFSGHLHEWLIEGRVNIAVLNDARRSRTTNVEHLLSVALFLVGPPAPVGAIERTPSLRKESFIDIKDIGNLQLLLPDRSHGIRRVIETQMAKTGAALNIALTIDSLAAMKELIADGFGYGILPYGSISSELQHRKFRAACIADTELTQECVLATSVDRPITLAMRTVIDYLRKNALAIHDRQLPAHWRRRPAQRPLPKSSSLKRLAPGPRQF